jgi:membrane associated rhomboid family serine protease
MVVLPIVFIIETISTSGRVACRAHVGATFVAELWFLHFSADFQKLQRENAVTPPPL